MTLNKNIGRYILVCFSIYLTSITAYAESREIDKCIDALLEKDINITQDYNTLNIYKGYDTTHDAYYKIRTSDEGDIVEYKIEVIDKDYSKIKFNKMHGFNWFADTYLDKDTSFLKEITKKMKGQDVYHTDNIDLGEWIFSAHATQLPNSNMHMTIKFCKDHTMYKTKDNNKVICNILENIGAIKNTSNKDSQIISFHLPYNRKSIDKSVYYNLFKNKENSIYKFQFICYKKGFHFQYSDIPGIKEVTTAVTKKSEFPYPTLNKQFTNLKKAINKDLKNKPTATSSWDYNGWKVTMDVTYYQRRGETRIKINIYHI